LVATSCNCFLVSSTVQFYTEINRHEIPKHQNSALLVTTDDGSRSTLTISDLLSKKNFPVWKHKAVSKSVKSFQKFNFEVISIIRSLSTNSISIVNYPQFSFTAKTTQLHCQNHKNTRSLGGEKQPMVIEPTLVKDPTSPPRCFSVCSYFSAFWSCFGYNDVFRNLFSKTSSFVVLSQFCGHVEKNT